MSTLSSGETQINMNELPGIIDPETFAELFAQYRQGVYYTAYRVCQNASDAEEIVSETYLKAFEHRHQYAGRSTVSTWLYRIAYHASVDLVKKKKREITWDDKYEMLSDSISATDSLLDKMVQDQQLQYLHQAMLQLSPEDRAILALRFERGLSYEEIANITGIAPNTVGTRIFRAKRLLMKHIPTGGDSNV